MTRTLLAILVLLAIAAPAGAAVRYAGPFGYPTIQAAVDAASGSDVVQIYPKVWNESVRITKSVTIEKYPIDGTATIAGTSAGAVVLDVYDGQYVTLRNIWLQGNGGPALRGPSLAARLPRVKLEEVVVWSGTTGISGFMHVRLEGSGVYYTSGAGIAITGSVDLDDVDIYGTGGAGIAVQSYSSSGLAYNYFDEVAVTAAGGTGIHLHGNASSTWIYNVEVDRATGIGIMLDGTNGATVDGVTVKNTRVLGGGWGDGLVVWKAIDVHAVRVTLIANARAGASAFGCVAPGKPAWIGLQASTMLRNPIDLVVDPAGSCAADAYIDDLGSNRCVAPDGRTRVCQSHSSSLAPPVPPPVPNL